MSCLVFFVFKEKLKVDKKYLLLLGAVILVLGGCGGMPFHDFYTDQTGGVSKEYFSKCCILLKENEEPKLIEGNLDVLEKDDIEMHEEGYLLMGYSNFNGGNVNESGAITQAKSVNASVVILYSKYTETISGSVPLTVPDIQTSYSDVSGTIYGFGGGSASYFGSGTTTTYGTQTSYIPYNQRRFDHFATFWIKQKLPAKHWILGMHFRPLPIEIRQKMGSNKGVLIFAVIKKGPFYMADIISGDVLLKIGEIEIYGKEDVKKTKSYKGNEVDVVIWREGKTITKKVKLGIGEKENTK
jgi:hypothetical protein